MIDDIYGSRADDVWIALDGYSKMEIRLFNPLVQGPFANGKGHQMNIPFSADEELIKKAREAAARQSSSLNRMIREYMEQLANVSDTNRIAEEFATLARQDGGKSPQGLVFICDIATRCMRDRRSRHETVFRYFIDCSILVFANDRNAGERQDRAAAAETADWDCTLSEDLNPGVF